MNISDIIEAFINDRIAGEGGKAEIKRNELAEHLGCVPSQINYVISSRFNPDRGYIVESRRGGGGYIKIQKISFDSKTAFLMHMLSAVGDSIDGMSAKAMLVSLYDNGIVTERELKLMLVSVSDRALIRIVQGKSRDTVRADIMKSLILTLK